MSSNTHRLEVWGDLACFSRPELKVERFSYPVITPSAARGIFDAIYLRPAEFRWQVTRIEVLQPPAFIALRRNEVKEVVNVNAVRRWMSGKASPEPLLADADRATTGSDEKGRTQRQTMALRDVRYRIAAEIRPWPGSEARSRAFDQQFRRRAERGKCFFQPYLGCREFPAYFELLPTDALPHERSPIDLDLDVGPMLYDVFDLSRPGSGDDPPSVSVFRGQLSRGVLEVPDYGSAEVVKLPSGGTA